jgi:hypothetical protein
VAGAPRLGCGGGRLGVSVGDHEQAFAAAHRKLLATRGLQFDFTAVPVPPPPPTWLLKLLKAIGPGFVAIAPALKYVFWGGLILGAVLIAWFIVRDLTRVGRGDRAAPAHLRQADAGWRPTVEKARALLSDADRLAAEGRYAEAAHLILNRSIDDFAGRRPGAVKPALTSRDLARAEAMPPEARATFAVIAEVVERSLFGGRPVDAARFAACRQAYEDFALPERWA